MENRIKKCQTDMLADRTPASTMRTNQLRLWFAFFAYVLVSALRRIGTQLAQQRDQERPKHCGKLSVWVRRFQMCSNAEHRPKGDLGCSVQLRQVRY
jgi:Transposase DDE domain group 1